MTPIPQADTPIKKAYRAFMEDVAKLNLKFPYASIAKRLECDKTDVKHYVRGEKQPDRNFLLRFYALFRSELQAAGVRRDIRLTLDEDRITLDKLTAEHRKLSDRLIYLCELQAEIAQKQYGIVVQMNEVIKRLIA